MLQLHCNHIWTDSLFVLPRSEELHLQVQDRLGRRWQVVRTRSRSRRLAGHGLSLSGDLLWKAISFVLEKNMFFLVYKPILIFFCNSENVVDFALVIFHENIIRSNINCLYNKLVHLFKWRKMNFRTWNVGATIVPTLRILDKKTPITTVSAMLATTTLTTTEFRTRPTTVLSLRILIR